MDLSSGCLAAALVSGFSFRFVEFRFCFMKSLGKAEVGVKGALGEVGVWETKRRQECTGYAGQTRHFIEVGGALTSLNCFFCIGWHRVAGAKPPGDWLLVWARTEVAAGRSRGPLRVGAHNGSSRLVGN